MTRLDRNTSVLAIIDVQERLMPVIANREQVERNIEVTVVADAVSSRTTENKEIALRRMMSDGAKLSSTEMAVRAHRRVRHGGVPSDLQARQVGVRPSISIFSTA